MTYLREETGRIIDRRRSAGYRDMLDSADPETGETLDDANIISQILTLLVAGSETSANAIAFAPTSYPPSQPSCRPPARSSTSAGPPAPFPKSDSTT
jgi:hypothetical protein